MLWFFKSFFPIVWIAFLLFWRIKAAGTKTTQRSEPAASGILRTLVFLAVVVLLSTTRIPLPWLYRQLWPSGLAPFWIGAAYHRGPSLRRLGAPAPRRQLEQRRNHQAGPRADYYRTLCPGPPPYLYGHSDRVSWHRDCALSGARSHRLCSNLPRALVQAAHGRGVDAFLIWGDLCHLCPSDRRPGAVSFLIAGHDRPQSRSSPVGNVRRGSRRSCVFLASPQCAIDVVVHSASRTRRSRSADKKPAERHFLLLSLACRI